MRTKYQINDEQLVEAEAAVDSLFEQLGAVLSNALRTKLRRVRLILASAAAVEVADTEAEAIEQAAAVNAWRYFAERYPAVPIVIMPAMYERHIARLKAAYTGDALKGMATEAFEKECRAYHPPSPDCLPPDAFPMSD